MLDLILNFVKGLFVKSNNLLEEISDVKKEWLVVNFGSRWSLDVYRKNMSELDILDEYNDWCKEVREDDCEYLIEEFGICNKFVSGMWSLCMSDDSTYWYIEVDKYKRLVSMFENRVDDNIVYDKLNEFEERYEVII